MRKRILWLTLSSLIMSTQMSGGADTVRAEVVETPSGVAVDAENDRFFVAYHDLNRISERRLSDLSEITQHYVGFKPGRLALSGDKKTLYTTLSTGGAISLYRPDSGTPAIEHDISIELDHSSTYDVIEGLETGVVFVSASPYSGGFAYIVRLDTRTGQAQRVASDRIIRFSPIFEIDRANGFLYVGSGSLLKLDAQLKEAPIVLEGDNGTNGGRGFLSVSPRDGAHILTTSGQVLRTASLTQSAMLVGPGAPHYSFDGSEIGVFYGTSLEDPVFSIYESSGYSLELEIDLTDCTFAPDDFDPQLGIAPLKNHGWLLWYENVFCRIPHPDRLFSDGLEPLSW